MRFDGQVQHLVKVAFSLWLVIKAELTTGRGTLTKEAMYQEMLYLVRTYQLKKPINVCGLY
jgi:hypothetical protein